MDYWDFADDLVPAGKQYWDFEPTPDYNNPDLMLWAEFMSSSMEGIEDAGAIQGLEYREAKATEFQIRDLIPQMRNLDITFDNTNTGKVTIRVPTEAEPYIRASLGSLADNLARSAEEVWGRTLKEGVDIDEFIWWPQLKDSTVKSKKSMGLTDAQARTPNLRTGDTARAMISHTFGNPDLVLTDEGVQARFGPKLNYLSSPQRMKYQEMVGGAGVGSENPAAGRGHHSTRPARNFGMTEALRGPVTEIISAWMADVNALQQRANPNLPPLDINQLTWSL
jgi:hypothetical protein